MSVELFFSLFSNQLVLLTLLFGGTLLKKCGIVTGEGRTALSDLLIEVILPCNIVSSFLGTPEIPENFAKNCAAIVLTAGCIEAFAICSGKLLFRGYEAEKRSVMAYGLISSNSSFIGIPVAEAMFSSAGVIYTAIFHIPVRLAIWTAGVALFTSVDKKGVLKRLVTHPCIVSIYIGVLFMVLHISPPAFLGSAVTMVGRCTTPFAMFVIGALLADAPMQSLFSKATLYYTAIRLIAFPLAVGMALLLIPMDTTSKAICVLMTAMPAGSTTAILADKYNCDAVFASQISLVSTVCSMITLPCISLLLTSPGMA